ncbi:MAG: acyl-ACP--UDP-N-acetylglucosamine O-acyltransferase [Thermoguttaceae bacterium]|nr:acyl-ACP--UDP-N-acetylglucosamine O-acyltransferase [Thermoguttaceae bacterium]MBR3218969.1 acyl-ACP--UDP-N-acetylglucosamine O-acyltransferase [Thermoguttaceae bacterium]
MYIHPTAIVSPKAKIGRDVQIGPFCVIEDDVVIGDGCILESRVTIKNGTTMGRSNHIFEGTVIGGLPQCTGIDEVNSRVNIGNGNVIRENVTIHRSMNEGDATEMGDDCMLMVNVHIAHDCHVADGVIMANNVMLAGHVSVGARANISGAVGIHQYCRIGSLAMVGGQAHIVKDVPPFVTVDGVTSQVVGLNLVGLRRAKYTTEERKVLKGVYKILYSKDLPWCEIVKKIEEQYTSGPGLEMANFISSTTRGIITARHSGSRIRGKAEIQTKENEAQEGQETEGMPATIRLHVVGEEG